MDDVPYTRILREGWAIILVAAFLGGALAYGITRPLPRTYAATSTTLLQVESAQTSLFERNQFSQARIKSYPALVDSPQVVDGVRRDLHLSPDEFSDRDIRGMLTATNDADTVLMNVRAEAPSADMAAAMANSATKHVSELIETTENDEADDRYLVTLVQALPAVVPQSAISPQVLPITGLGLITGFAAGALIALYRTTTKRRFSTIADIRRASGLPVIAQIPKVSRRWHTRAHRNAAHQAACSEAVSNLMTLAGPWQRTFVLVPATPGAIETDALTCLLNSYRIAGRRARILDARKDIPPSDEFGLLSELIQADRADALNEFDASQPTKVYQAAKLTTEEIEAALPGIVTRFDDPRDVTLVVIDPGDASLLTAVSAPIIIGVRSGDTTVADLLAITIRLQVMSVHPLGVLFTGARARVRTSVALTWNELDRLNASVIRSDRPPSDSKIRARPSEQYSD